MIARALAIALLAACGAAGTPPAPAPQPAPPVAPRAKSSNDCSVLPQPSKPGHATVEPDDMACTHGDTFYDCPAGVDLSAQHCAHPLHKGWWSQTTSWCCPR